MKKYKKTVDSSSFRIYLDIVKRLLLNNLLWLMALVGCLATPLRSELPKEPYFLIFNDGVNLTQEARFLEKAGGRIIHKIPPQIMVTELPVDLNLSQLTNLKLVISSPLDPNELAAYGPLAVAMGHQWNQSLLKKSKKIGMGAFSAMQQTVISESIPAPRSFSLTQEGSFIRSLWDPVDGRSFYEIQFSPNEVFDNPVINHTGKIGCVMLLPEVQTDKVIFARVRAVERTNLDGQTVNLYGSWSNIARNQVAPKSVSPTPVTPELSSPLDTFDFEGFTIILEWNSQLEDSYQVQVAEAADFKRTLIDEVAGAQEFTPPSDIFRVGGTYYWRVRLVGSQEGPWSKVRDFRVSQPRTIGSDMFANPEAPR